MGMGGWATARAGKPRKYLALGADPEKASREPVRRALVASLIPAIVMFMLASSVAITATLVTLWYRRAFFIDAAQLR
jgi:ABC-type iron transport system FetAB permease component